MLGLAFEHALWDEKREVGVLDTGFLDPAVEFPLHVLPKREAVRPDHLGSPDRRVVGQFGLLDDFHVPAVKIILPIGDFFNKFAFVRHLLLLPRACAGWRLVCIRVTPIRLPGLRAALKTPRSRNEAGSSRLGLGLARHLPRHPGRLPVILSRHGRRPPPGMKAGTFTRAPAKNLPKIRSFTRFTLERSEGFRLTGKRSAC